MKKIFLIMITLGFISSCYSDKSASDYDIVPPITIDFEGTPSVLYVKQFENIEIKPIVHKEGIADENLSFEWLIYGNDIVPKVIGTNMSLNAEIDGDIRSSAVAYDLKYKVTDKTTGLYVEQLFKVNVTSSYTGGLYVADTRDETMGDISLIESRNFRTATSKDTVYRDIYYKAFGSKIDGLVTSIASNWSKSADRLNSTTIGTNKSVERVQPYSMDKLGLNENIFIDSPESFNVSAVSTNRYNGGQDFIINDGRIYSRAYSYYTTLFGYQFRYADNREYEARVIGEYSKSAGLLFSYDELNGEFIAGSLFSGNIFPLTISDEQRTMYKDYTCLHVSKVMVGTNEWITYIMKHKTNGDVRMVRFSYNPSPTSMALIDEQELGPTKFTGIDSATSFSEFTNGRLMYYSSGDKVHSIYISSNGSYSVYEEFTAPAGELVTMVKTYNDSYMYGRVSYVHYSGSKSERSSTNNMVLVVTHNETTKEGIVRIIPLTANASYGELEKDKSYHVEFGGFGRITAIGYQYDASAQ